jgi:type II secretory pathway pseudopilin PulG
MRMNSLSKQHGFTMVAVMVTMLVTGLLGIAAFASVNGDLPFSRDSKDRKLAYGAAEAGLNYYLFQLNRDFDYFLKCNTGPPPNASELNPVNQKWDGAGVDPRNFRKVQGGQADYAIEMMPANGNTQCLVNNGPTVVDQASSTFALRTTGRSGEVKRSVGATLRRKSFLDYLYFTDFETRDPKVYAAAGDQVLAAANCAQPRAGREAQSNFNCVDIVFADDDSINGPLHTNDDILTCGTPSFGRNVNDRIEVVGPLPGTAPSGGSCPGGSPVMNGTFAAGAQALLMPLTSQPLVSRALPGYLYTGKTTIVLNGVNMDVTNPSVVGNLGVLNTPKTMPLPTNGVIYVKQNSCAYSVAPIIADYLEPNTCANLYVSGTYASSLTIASQNDIIINGDVTSSNDAILGMIADNFVRVYHPVVRSSGNCVANVQAPRNFRIDSALVSLLHSFIVDNHTCGAHLGNLTINGAIAQKFRGPVGQNGATGPGYTKVYGYDDRFRYRSPPYFVEPVAAAWRVLRTNEQVPAR